MKTLVVKASGTATPGDTVILSYSGPRGGRSDAKITVQDVDLARLVSQLAEQINSEKSEWCPGSGDFKATAQGTTLYVQCSDLVSDVKFSCEVTGAMTEKFELRELARA